MTYDIINKKMQERN